MTITRQLVKQRKRLGLSQLELASRMDLTQATIAAFEVGVNPLLRTVERYASAVGLKIIVVREDEVCEGED